VKYHSIVWLDPRRFNNRSHRKLLVIGSPQRNEARRSRSWSRASISIKRQCGAASRKRWPELLQAGIKIYEYQPVMVHVKLMVVDGAFVSVGSGNLDLRSIRLNDEAKMNVLNRSFASQQTRLFEMDKRRSREITLNETGKLGFAHPLQQAASVAAPEL
jgi:phosphatidylserine/phosphatidylglycerophosphate/cardiolipin synthase-like enzyme